MQDRNCMGPDVLHRSEGNSQPRPDRRQFFGLLATAAGASAVFTGTTAAQDSPVISMGNTYFDPIGLHIEQGTTVRFEIEAGSHSATAYEDRIPTEASLFDSGVISEGGFEHSFDEPGTYDYYCIPHESMGMVGRIVVGEPGGPAEQNPIPVGSVPDSDTIVEEGAVSVDGESDGNHGGGMGPGMMDGGPWWMMLMPIGFLSVLLASVGGVTYWASKRCAARGTSDDSAMTSVRKEYARGEIDDEEFQQRRD